MSAVSNEGFMMQYKAVTTILFIVVDNPPMPHSASRIVLIG